MRRRKGTHPPPPLDVKHRKVPLFCEHEEAFAKVCQRVGERVDIVEQISDHHHQGAALDGFGELMDVSRQVGAMLGLMVGDGICQRAEV